MPCHKISNKATSPICSGKVEAMEINKHIDAGCSQTNHKRSPSASTSKSISPLIGKTRASQKSSTESDTRPIAPIFNIKPKRVESESSPPSSESVPTAKRGAADDDIAQGPPLKRARINLQEAAPLAEKLRPTTLSEFVGHESVVSIIASGCSGSLILWGPSG